MSGRGDFVVGLDCLEKLKSKISREWKAVGRGLGLSEEDLDRLAKDRNFEGHSDVCYGMLCAWKTKKGKAATYKVLAKALRQAERTDLAEDLMDGKFDSDTAADNNSAASNNISEVSQSISTRADPGTVSGDRPTKRPAASAMVHLPRYKMDNKIRGKCLILTYDEFWKDDGTPDEEWNRPGNEVDSENLENVFTKLGFDVDNETNLNKEATMKIIKKMAKKSSFDSFVLFVCSHGNEKSFYTSDKEEIALQDVITPFKVENCKGFADKPKMFFFSTCRGNAKEKMVKYEKDQRPDAKKIGVAANIDYYRPNEADFIVVLSTVPGYISWRSEEDGTCFVESLCTCLTDNYETHQLIDILVMNNESLLHKFEEMRECVGICQVPTIILTLSKAVYFVDELK